MLNIWCVVIPFVAGSLVVVTLAILMSRNNKPRRNADAWREMKEREEAIKKLGI